ncbi:MAG: GAF domain-containing protein [Salinivirgaceae bacterium]|jgi:hypothetical protein|nr:GAF domain-containing protein [Salinivirgaceae bacterium]
MQTTKVLFISLILFLFIGTKSSHGQEYLLEDGFIDVTHVNWENHLVKFEGTCDFYWQEFLLPDSVNDALPGHKKYSAPLPKPWTKITLDDNSKIPAEGYGTYRIRIKVDNRNEVYGLKLRSIFTAYKLYVNGELLSSLGTIGKTKEESVPRFLTQEIALPVIARDSIDYQVLDVVLHVSNFHHRRAGAQQPILFGTIEEIIDATENTLILNFFLIGIILIIGINHMLMYALRRLDIGNLLFGMLSIIMILRNLSTDERILMHWFPNMNWELLVKLDNFSGFGTMSFFALYFYFSYRKAFPKLMFYILTGIGILITLLVFSTNAWFYGQFKLIFEAYIGLGGLYLVFGVLLRASFQQQKGAFITFIGMFLLYATAVNDLLYSMGVVNSAYIAPYGIAAFMVLQSFLLTKKSAVALLDNQKLSLELGQEKQSLEERIEERTQKLSHQAEELKNYQKEQEQQNWINEGLNEITDVMRRNKDNLSQLADQLLSHLVKRVNATLGAMYFHVKADKEEHLKLLAHFGLNKEAQLENIGLKEGLTGQCFSLGKEKYMEDLPEKYFSISSGLGSSTPKILALIPMKIDELVIGVIELASFKPISDTNKEFLKRATENIASQLNIVKMNEESQALIDESRKLEQETLSKNREMRETLEKMQAIQEEDEIKDKEIQKLLDEAKQREADAEAKL